MINLPILYRFTPILRNAIRNVNQIRSLNRLIVPISTKCVCQNQNVLAIQFARNYAKGKDKKKEKGKQKVQINESELSAIINVETMKSQMQRAIDGLKIEYVKHVSLRSTTGSIESIIVHFDGKDHTLQELAQIVRKNPKLIVVNMSVFPQAIPAVLKSISQSGLNVNPQQEGTTLYIPVPKVTKEHREGLLKNAKSLYVKCRDNIRDAQNKQTKILKKLGISKDETHSAEQQVIAIADSYIAQAENVFESKQTELIGKE